ncbi:MAG TPA: hypothetical protein VGX28_10935 [Frankiaceae bacterium]|nr:hypothetical protein [Frankiaceae bacterium]
MSSATLATISVGDLAVAGQTIDGHTISVGTLSAIAQTLSQDAPAVSFVPITLDGVKKGEVTVTPQNSPKTVGGVTSGALPLNVLSASSPTATLSAAKSAAGPVSSLSASLGQASLLGLPLGLDGSVKVGSATEAAKSQAGKTLTISNVSLPSIADVLAALGIDLGKLPIDTLNGLVDSLPIDVPAMAETALAAVNTQIEAADDAYEAASADFAAKAADLQSKAAALDAALAPFTVPVETLPEGIDLPITHSEWDSLSATPAGVAVQEALKTADALDTIDDPLSAYVAAKAAYGTATGALATALAAIQPLIDDLAELVDGVLADIPLVEIGAAQVGTSALAGATKSANVTGYVSGVKVLGQDVLQTVTNNTKLDVAGLAGTVASQVNTTIAGATQALSSVLATATGLTVPAPSVKLLVKSTSTGTEGAFGTAKALVTALQVELGSATIPTQFALTDAASLPAILPTATGFKTAPLSLKVGELGESAKFRPASTTGVTPTTPGSHPATGVPAGLGIVAVIGTALAFGARRMTRSEA